MFRDLAERTMTFARDVRDLCKELKKDVINNVYIQQLIRSGSSIGANYIEANESLGAADRKMHIRISRKEAKESKWWLRLIVIGAHEQQQAAVRVQLIDEAEQLRKIMSSILQKLEASPVTWFSLLTYQDTGFKPGV
ncbi:four helix bundle protein [uncultured Chitinophaga sp.]|jgi:S23 ribosomal protein.|uniref:four helix bundle protein n=1 Tax=uncultured Chitinophaga sp. TaxID=339340 RepID=UPI00261B90CE|nr:four helix bundle protein [uncultured Chitinophaga sp.]